MYDKLIAVVREYVGVVAPVFVDACLKEAGVTDKENITAEDLDKIAQAAFVKTSKYTLQTRIDEPLKHEVVFDRIKISDPVKITHKATRS